MLKPAAYAAECFLADTQVRSDTTQRYPFQDMRRLFYQVFITISCRSELGVHISLLQPDIVSFIDDPYQSFYIVVLIEETGKRFLADAPKGAAFQQLDIFNGSCAGNKTMKGGNEIILKTEPVGYFFAIQVIKSTKGAFLQEIQMPAGIALRKQEVIFAQCYFCKTFLQCIFCFGT